jgi:hypothetical protein
MDEHSTEGRTKKIILDVCDGCKKDMHTKKEKSNAT